jgi:potassium efflux system protein
LRNLLIRLMIFCVASFGAAAFCDEQSLSIDQINQRLDRARTTLDEIEKTLAEPALTDGGLKNLRDKIEPLPGDLEQLIEQLTPRLRAIQARLDELGKPATEAKPADKAEEAKAAPPPPAPVPPAVQKPPEAKPAADFKNGKASAGKPSAAPPPPPPPPAPVVDPNSAAASINAELTEQRKLYDDTDATLKRARSLLLQTQQATQTIIARQRALFTQTLFLRTSGLFAPSLWNAAIREFPTVIGGARDFLSDRMANVGRRLEGGHYAEFIGVVLLIFLAIPPAVFLARRVLARSASKTDPTKAQKAIGAAWAALVTAAIPLAAIGALSLAIDEFDLVDHTLEPVLRVVVDSLMRIVAAYALARGLLSPSYSQWRVVDVDDAMAKAGVRFFTSVAVVVTVTRILEQLEESVQAALRVVVVTRGVGALIVACLVAAAVIVAWRGRKGGDDSVGLSSSSVDWSDRLRFLGVGAVVVIIGACAAGYVTLASFIIAQTGWILAVLATLYLVVNLLQAGVEKAFEPKSPIARILVSGVGVRRESLAQFSVLISGVITLTSFLIAGLVALTTFGVQSGDFLSGLQSAFFSFKIGDVTISLSSIVTAIALFAAVLGATHGLQRWLNARYLPLTRLDMGLRNSIVTSVGYAGFILAISVVLGHLGLGFERLAIVAGALSVGIGFGLQSIVNNFVSGLILLWERAIRVGDWVVIGDEQGYVKRINVRTTEVETFDRATMIVPNSNLVAGVVKNWLRGDKVGRIKISLSPHVGVDPEEMRDILLASARAQDGVLRIPAPQVMFLGLEAAAFRFELWCYVEDVEQATRVRSDLHFDLHKRLSAAGITIAAACAPPEPSLQLAGIEKFMAAAVATAIAAEALSGKDAEKSEKTEAEKAERSEKEPVLHDAT